MCLQFRLTVLRGRRVLRCSHSGSLQAVVRGPRGWQGQVSAKSRFWVLISVLLTFMHRVIEPEVSPQSRLPRGNAFLIAVPPNVLPPYM